IDLRILGWAGTDQTLQQTSRRFGPWLTASLWLMLVTGILMVIGEPVRELVTFSFWFKMVLVAIGTIIAALFRKNLRQHERQWEDRVRHRASRRGWGIASFLIWFGATLLGASSRMTTSGARGHRRQRSSGHPRAARLAPGERSR